MSHLLLAVLTLMHVCAILAQVCSPLEMLEDLYFVSSPALRRALGQQTAADEQQVERTKTGARTIDSGLFSGSHGDTHQSH